MFIPCFQEFSAKRCWIFGRCFLRSKHKIHSLSRKFKLTKFEVANFWGNQMKIWDSEFKAMKFCNEPMWMTSLNKRMYMYINQAHIEIDSMKRQFNWLFPAYKSDCFAGFPKHRLTNLVWGTLIFKSAYRSVEKGICQLTCRSSLLTVFMEASYSQNKQRRDKTTLVDKRFIVGNTIFHFGTRTRKLSNFFCAFLARAVDIYLVKWILAFFKRNKLISNKLYRP